MLNSFQKLRELIEKGENQQLDFKETITSAMKIATTIVSFANTNGGEIIVGVKDTGGIRGINIEEEKFMFEKAVQEFIQPKIELNYEIISNEKKSILVVKIPESETKPHYAKDEKGKWWVFVRVNDNTILARKTVLEILKRKSQNINSLIQYSPIEKQLLEYLNQNKNINLKTFAKLAEIKPWQASKILINLASSNVLKLEITEKEDLFYL